MKKPLNITKKLLEISVAIGDKLGIARDNENLGNAYLSLDDYETAIKYQEKGLEISSAIGDKSAIACGNGNLGNAYLSLEEYEKAFKYYEKALEIRSPMAVEISKPFS